MLIEIIGLLAAIILFLYGIEQLSKELTKQAGERFRNIISKLASNILSGTFIGAAVTTILQSSTATTVIAVGLVNAGIITFKQSLGIIAGANIGTTITAQLVAFNFMQFAPFFIVLGFLISVFGREYKFVGKGIFFFGLLFFALTLISLGIQPFKEDPLLLSIIKTLDNSLIGIAVGIFLTILFQSSSVVTGLIVLLAMEGIISVEIAIPIVLGSNIGTTTTALLASLKMDVFAKRSAVAHTLFNIIGVVIIFPFLPQFTDFVIQLGGNSGSIVANAHTIFNIAAAAIFILLSNYVVKFIEKIVPGKEKEIVFRAKYIEDIPKNTNQAIKSVLLELKYRLDIIKEILDLSTEMIVKGEIKHMPRIEKLKALNDYLDKKVLSALIVISQRELNKKQSSNIVVLSRVSYEIKKIGDIAYDYALLAVRLDEENLKLSAESCMDIIKVKEGSMSILNYLMENIQTMDKRKVTKMEKMRKDIDSTISIAHKHRIKILSSRRIGTHATLIFLDSISALEHSNSAFLRIARLLATLSK